MKHKLFIILMLLSLGSVYLWSQNPCLDFDGVNDYAVIPDNSSLNPTRVTVEGWLYLNSVTSRPYIIGKGTSSNGSYWLVIETTRRPRLFFTVGNAGTWQFVEGSTNVPLNTWFHLAGTYNGTTAIIYVDGVQRGSTSANPSGNLKTNDTNPLYFARAYQPAPALYLDGMMDEVRIWNYARSSTQISDNMDDQLSGVQEGLVGYWQMNEDTGNTIEDIYGNNDGTVFGASWADGPETLPFELSSFTATFTAQNFVTLLWTTQSEINCQGYYIYRGTTDQVINAQIVSPMIQAHNTSITQNYSFVDNELTENGLYYYWLQSVDFEGSFSFHGPIAVDVNFDGEGGTPFVPIQTGLRNIYPNPFTANAAIAYEVDKAANVRIEIYNTKGQLIRSFEEGSKSPNAYTLDWDGKDANGNVCPSGVYIFRMHAGSNTSTRKAILTK